MRPALEALVMRQWEQRGGRVAVGVGPALRVCLQPANPADPGFVLDAYSAGAAPGLGPRGFVSQRASSGGGAVVLYRVPPPAAAAAEEPTIDAVWVGRDGGGFGPRLLAGVGAGHGGGFGPQAIARAEGHLRASAVGLAPRR
jgi:hypothetical protein